MKPAYIPLEIPEDGKLAQNIAHFARALRKAGLPVGPGKVLDAVHAVQAAGFSEKRDFYWVLHAVFVSRPEHRAVFAQVFRLYWRDPQYLEHMMALMLPAVQGVQEDRAAQAAEKRAAQALFDDLMPDLPEEETGGTEIDMDASATASSEERLRTLDFEQMSVAEMDEARRIISRLRLPVPPVLSRRTGPDPAGVRPDWPRSMRRAMRRGGDLDRIERRSRRKRPPTLLALCDISGSMSSYSRAVLQFLHAVMTAPEAQDWGDVHAFTFGTRLTPVTRHLATRDVDAALAAAGAEAQDWQGGTRIGECVYRFNRDWARRLMGQGAVVLLITDGLDRDDPELLGASMACLRRMARQVIWVNPLLRFDGFAPRARGIAAMLPHVDSLRAGHNIAALQGLAEALARPLDPGKKTRLMAML